MSCLFKVRIAYFICLPITFTSSQLSAETLRQPIPFVEQLQSTGAADLAHQARQRGNAHRGGLVFYKSGAACVNCHLQTPEGSPLGPKLAELGEVTDTHVIDSLLYPSKSIRKGYETQSVLTTSGEIIVGMVAKEDNDSITLRSVSDLNQDRVIPKKEIEAVKPNAKSMMPEGLVASIGNLRDFLDLACYLIEIAEGGSARAKELMPSPEELQFKDDTLDLDHAGIISTLRSRDFETGKGIYHGYCFNCHGNDGNTPSLPTARAFGNQKMRFGSDPFRMFMTLSHGKGLMAAMRHLTPKERYQVVHYVREQFMKPSNPDYFVVDKAYLASLPTGTRNGSEQPNIIREYGPALASQLGRQYSSVLNVNLGKTTIAYNLHSMDQAGIWRGGLDLSETQHVRDRGEGTVSPLNDEIHAWSDWAWGHEGTLEYPREGILPRGPLPPRWMDYRGHYIHGKRVVLSYSIDGRAILETPAETKHELVHAMQIMGGVPLILSVAQQPTKDGVTSTVGSIAAGITSITKKTTAGDADQSFIIIYDSDGAEITNYTAAAVTGDTARLRWLIDSSQRLCLQIPEDQKSRNIAIHRTRGNGTKSLERWIASLQPVTNRKTVAPADLITGGKLRWPQTLHTVGYPGLEPSGYALDTLTLPESTPWNTWFRTSALDFFSDGRMALSTYGGDIWIVSGIDRELRDIRWKRFAAGLYEPFGVKIVDNHVFVTCKDRIVKLHDLNQDGEADFHENFSPDTDVSVNFHAFNFDLQTDAVGNFYYSKSGHGADSTLPGAVIKISPDGKRREVFSTGFRTPNGMGMLPDGRPTVSDNQGQWTPASKVSLLKPKGFYGWVQTYSIPGKWEPGGGTIDVKKVIPPSSFDPPLVWMPQDFDNSSGGQLWVDDERWGPLSGHLLHTSFGKGWMSYLMMQEVEGQSQAAIAKLPFDFSTGIMRARVNPSDGQVYATGLQGWNGGGRAGLLDGGLQRLRYTGQPWKMVSDCKVEKDGLRIIFNFALDPDSATDPESYLAEHWNYHWRSSYGSDRYSPQTDKPGVDKIGIESVTLGSDGKSVKLNIPNMIPVDQTHIIVHLKAEDGSDFEEEIYWTINRVPEQ